jgi:hypothetical protein
LTFFNGPSLAQQLSADGEQPGTRIEIRSLQRDEGGTLTLRFQLINDGTQEVNSCSYREYGGNDPCGTVSGAHLIDAGNKKKYLVIRDSGKKCVCAEGVDHLRRGRRLNAWAKFPAPPDNVQKITVVFPGFEPIDGVPITSR